MGSRPPGCVVVPPGTRSAPIFAQKSPSATPRADPRRVYEAIPTKATLLDDELLALLVQNEIAISLSMDGPKSLTEA